MVRRSLQDNRLVGHLACAPAAGFKIIGNACRRFSSTCTSMRQSIAAVDRLKVCEKIKFCTTPSHSYGHLLASTPPSPDCATRGKHGTACLENDPLLEHRTFKSKVLGLGLTSKKGVFSSTLDHFNLCHDCCVQIKSNTSFRSPFSILMKFTVGLGLRPRTMISKLAL